MIRFLIVCKIILFLKFLVFLFYFDALPVANASWLHSAKMISPDAFASSFMGIFFFALWFHPSVLSLRRK